LDAATMNDVLVGDHGVVEIPTAGFRSATRPIVTVTYVNGYVNTLLSGPAAVAATSFTVASALGVYPGLTMTIYDVTAAGTERVVVAPTYVPGATTVPVVTPLRFRHATGISVSNVPPRVKQAAVLLTSALIQTRGNDAIVLDSLDTASRLTPAYGANADAERMAGVLLGSLRRVI